MTKCHVTMVIRRKLDNQGGARLQQCVFVLVQVGERGGATL